MAQDQRNSARQSRNNGFDLVRLGLAASIVAFHSFTLTHGSAEAMPQMIQAAARLILPAFFALSGFLVAGSLARSASLREFLLLRLLRLLPALSLVVSVTALLLGPLLTVSALGDYFRDPLVPLYFRNIWGQSEFHLPGVFAANPRPGVVNGTLWTIPLEMACYVALAGLALSPGPRRCALLAPIFVLLVPGLGLPNQDFFASFALGTLLFAARSRLPRHGLWGPGSIAAALLLEYWIPALPLVAVPLSYGVIWLGSRSVPAWATRGDYSYGLYLCAYPLQQMLVAAVPGQNWKVNLALALPLGLGCAMLLWHGIERPVLDRKHELIARLQAGLARA